LLFEQQDPAYKRSVLGTSRARVAVEAGVELGWERYTGLEGRFIGMHGFGASGKIGDVYKKFDITARPWCGPHAKRLLRSLLSIESENGIPVTWLARLLPPSAPRAGLRESNPGTTRSLRIPFIAPYGQKG
jgi:hypothetical protein